MAKLADPAGGGGELGAPRYQLVVVEQAGAMPLIQVFDRVRNRSLLDWRGAVVRHLLECGALPPGLCRSGCYACDKWFVWNLILAGAAARMALERLGGQACESN